MLFVCYKEVKVDEDGSGESTASEETGEEPDCYSEDKEKQKRKCKVLDSLVESFLRHSLSPEQLQSISRNLMMMSL